MNRAWITGWALAGVAGSAGAAFAGISSDSQGGSPVEAQGLVAETSSTEAAIRTATYQVGAAGTVTLTIANGVLNVDSTTASAPWLLGGYTTPAAHVEVPFSDAAQQVTFIADLVNDEIVVSVTNIPAPGATTSTSIEVTEITSGGGSVAAPKAAPAPQAVAPAPQAATPAPPAATRTPQVVVPVAKPSAGHTSMPSSDDEEEHSESDHEESHDHENESHDD
jgi:hypothetical protein